MNGLRPTPNRLRTIPTVKRCACGEIVIASEMRPEELRWCRGCRAFVDAVLRAPPMPAPVAPPALPQGFGRVFLPNEGTDLFAYVDQVERSLIQQALDRSGGNVARAARLLGMNRTTLIEKRKRHDLLARRELHPPVVEVRP